jgi:hypothetical protein
MLVRLAARGDATHTQRRASGGHRRITRRCSSLDFGRFGRRTLLQAADAGVTAGQENAFQPQDNRDIPSLRSIAEDLCRADRQAVLSTIGSGRFPRAARHVVRRRHLIRDYYLSGGGVCLHGYRLHGHTHAHCGSCKRGKRKPDNCQDGQQTAHGGESPHASKISTKRFRTIGAAPPNPATKSPAVKPSFLCPAALSKTRRLHKQPRSLPAARARSELIS